MPDSEKEDDEKNIEYKKWVFYQETARHFNELIIDLRTKSLTVVVSLSAASIIISQKMIIQFISNFVISCSILVIYLFWKCIHVIDIYYYQNLLLGTIKTISENEEKNNEELKINLTRNISQQTSEKVTSLFYNISSLILIILSFIFLKIWKDVVESKDNSNRISELTQLKNIELSKMIYENYYFCINILYYILILIIILEIYFFVDNLKIISRHHSQKIKPNLT
nr:hypothetical protein GTC16762_33310 [Pigmentibacter ruber]